MWAQEPTALARKVREASLGDTGAGIKTRRRKKPCGGLERVFQTLLKIQTLRREGMYPVKQRRRPVWSEPGKQWGEGRGTERLSGAQPCRAFEARGRSRDLILTSVTRTSYVGEGRDQIYGLKRCYDS